MLIELLCALPASDQGSKMPIRCFVYFGKNIYTYAQGPF